MSYIFQQKQHMQKNYDYILKLVIIGSSSVGKSSILRRFADDQFQQNYISTIGIDFRFKSLYIDQSFVKLQIWDTAGQERFRGITKSYYKGANAVILVYDITSPKSFEDLLNFWTKETRQYSPQDRIYCLINKCDEGESTEVPPEHLQYLEENHIKWFKVSAKMKINVTESILQIARETMKKQPKANSQSGQKGLPNTHVRQEDRIKCCNNG